MFMYRHIQYFKMSVFPTSIYRFNIIPIKIPSNYFLNINELILKFMWGGKRPILPNKVVKNKVLLTLHDFKTSTSKLQ